MTKEPAFDLIVQLIWLFQFNPLFQLHYAQHLHFKKKYSEAKEYYEKVILYDKSMFEAYYNLGDIYTRLNQHQLAINMYKEVYDITKSYLKQYITEQELPESTIQKIKKNKSLLENALLFMAQIYLYKSQPNDAVKFLYERHVMLPHDLDTIRLIGICFFQLSKWEQSNKFFNLYLERDPDHLRVIELNTIVLMNLNKKNEARLLMKAYIKKHPRSKKAQQILKSIR